jgi:S-adenosyl methyltransferase
MRPGHSCRFRPTARRHSPRGGAACRLLCTPGTWLSGPARSCTPTRRGRSPRARLAARTGVPRPVWPQPPDQTAAVVGALRHAACTPAAGSSRPRRGVPEWREGRGVRHDGRVPTQTEFNPDIPSAARVYDYVLGGKNHYPADREVAEAVLARTPSLRSAVKANRGFPGFRS